MATITTNAGHLSVELGRWERLAALHGDVTVERRHVARARVSDTPFAELRGFRLPGTGVPGLIAMGRWRRRHGADFVLLRRGDRAVVIELAPGAPYRRLIVGCRDPEAVVAALGS